MQLCTCTALLPPTGKKGAGNRWAPRWQCLQWQLAIAECPLQQYYDGVTPAYSLCPCLGAVKADLEVKKKSEWNEVKKGCGECRPLDNTQQCLSFCWISGLGFGFSLLAVAETFSPSHTHASSAHQRLLLLGVFGSSAMGYISAHAWLFFQTCFLV